LNVIISCGKKKVEASKAIPLDELYSGHQTKLKIRLAKLLAPPENIYIISGRLGLVPLETKSLSYDSNNRLPDSELVREQVEKYRILKGVYIGQKKYYIFLKKFIPGLYNLIVARNSQDFCFKLKQLIESWGGWE